MSRSGTSGAATDKVTMVPVSRFPLMVMAFVACAAASGASASTLTPDLSPLHSAAPALARGGDFDGDGRFDDLYLSDDGNGRTAVHVRLNAMAGPRDLRVTSLESEGQAPLRVVPAGRYAADCGSFATDCGAAVETSSDGLMLGLGSGSTVLIHWNGADFDTDFVRDDQAEMARALSTIFALNP